MIDILGFKGAGIFTKGKFQAIMHMDGPYT